MHGDAAEETQSADGSRLSPSLSRSPNCCGNGLGYCSAERDVSDEEEEEEEETCT